MSYMETTQASAAWLGQSHGYRIDGDLACLNAELALPNLSQAALDQEWALQLWACEQPYHGGALQGVKIAEAAVDLAHREASQPQHLYAETFARLPAGDRAYSMVMVLASRSDDARELVHDFANYPALEHFHVPALRGEVSVEREDDKLTLRAERIENPRTMENLSGSLALELWALPEAYRGGQFAGTALAGVELGRLAGQASLQGVELQLSAAALTTHTQLTVMLREWTADGYVTRDYRNLASEVIAQPTSFVLSVSEPVPDARLDIAPEPEAPSVVVSPVIPVAEAKPVTPPTAAAAGLVSVQQASVDQLAAVPGLSRKLALEIIKSRPFRSLDELTRVRGIGEKTLRKLRALLTL